MKGTTNRSCIYCIHNLVTGQRYIGSTINLTKRFSEHHQALKANRHTNRYLQRAWNKYGSDAFDAFVLEDCSPENLIERENAWIAVYQSNHRSYGYNTRLDAQSSAGVKLSDETRRKMSESHIGRKQSADHAAKQCAARRGVKRTPAQIAKMAEACRSYDVDVVKEIQRLLNEMPESWGKKSRIGQIVGVRPAYVSRIANNPPQWLRNLNDAFA